MRAMQKIRIDIYRIKFKSEIHSFIQPIEIFISVILIYRGLFWVEILNFGWRRIRNFLFSNSVLSLYNESLLFMTITMQIHAIHLDVTHTQYYDSHRQIVPFDLFLLGSSHKYAIIILNVSVLILDALTYLSTKSVSFKRRNTCKELASRDHHLFDKPFINRRTSVIDSFSSSTYRIYLW